MPGSQLHRLAVRGRCDRSQRCDLCPATVADPHRHLLDTARGTLRCACPACAREPGERYRPVPVRARRLADFVLDDLAWISLGVPVGLALFVRDGRTGTISAHYPNPAGTTTASIDQDSWAVLAGPNPCLAELDAGVQGLLVDRLREPAEYWLLPLDECHRLGTVLRDGTGRFEDRVERFLARVR